MTDTPTDIANLPLRMLASEVCKVARISKQTLNRRIADGSLDLRAVDRGREKIYLRADVIRAFGLGEDPVANRPVREWKNHDAVDVEGIRAAIAARGRKPSTKPPQPDPVVMTPDRHRAFLLSVRPGIRVGVAEDGRYEVSFVARSNVRALTWPAEIILPRANPGPVTLATEAELDELVTEAVAIRAECRAALLAENAQEGRKSGR